MFEDSSNPLCVVGLLYLPERGSVTAAGVFWRLPIRPPIGTLQSRLPAGLQLIPQSMGLPLGSPASNSFARAVHRCLVRPG
jgi:hypothetical protein